jgi:hypothetical protein
MARGILVDLLSRPDGWEATADDMWRASVAKHGKASPGRRAFRAAFAELKEHGYLTAERTILTSGQHGTILALTDVSAGGTDVPHAGTSETPTDVPHAGTSERPAETNETPAHADVPHGGTPDSPAETPKTAGRSDVPHAGTSSSKNGLQNTGKKTSSSAAAPAAPHQDEEDLTAFGAFWLVYPKSRDRPATLAAWRNAIASGADPKKIVDAAQAYARDRAGQEARFTKFSANWLRDERYEDDYAQPEANGVPQLRALPGASHFPTREDAALAKRNASRAFLDQLADQLRASGDET